MAANPRVRNYALRVRVDNAFNQGFMSAPQPSAFFLDFHCRMCGVPRTMRFLMENPRRFEFSGNCSCCNAHFSFSPFETPALEPGERFYYLISFRITGPLSLDSLEVSEFQVSWTTQLAVGGRLHFHTRDETFTVLVGGAPPGAVFEEESDSDDYAEDPESDDDAEMVVGGVNQGQVADEGGVVLNGVNGVNGANGVNGFPGMHGELVIGSFSIPAPNGVNFDVMVFQPGDVVSQLIGLRLQFHRL